MKGSRTVAVVVVVVGLLVLGVWYSLQPEQAVPPAAIPIGTPVEIATPLGLPPVPIPADNPPRVETIALGRRLYYDPIL